MSRLDRVLAGAALAYPVLTVAAFVAFPKPPGGDVSPAHDPAWLAAHSGAVIAQGYLRAAAALGFLALTLAIATRLDDTVRRPVLLGGGGTGILLLLAQAPVLAAALGTRESIPAVGLRLADPLNAALLDLASVPAIVLFAAAAIGLAGRGGPRALVWLTGLGVPLAAVDALSYDGGPLAAVALVGLAYFLVWSLLVAAWLIRDAMAGEHRGPASRSAGGQGRAR